MRGDRNRVSQHRPRVFDGTFAKIPIRVNHRALDRMKTVSERILALQVWDSGGKPHYTIKKRITVRKRIVAGA